MDRKNKWESRWVTALVILVFLTASVISTNQYRYGIYDHSIIIPFLKSSLNAYYPDDFILSQKPFYYTYLWNWCALLINIFNISIPVLFFIGYCVSVFFIFLGTYLIAKTLFGKHEVGFLSLFFLLFNIKTFAGSITIDYIFLTRVVALPALIFSVYFFLREKYFTSSLLQGLGFLIHPMTAVYFMVMQGVALLFSVKYAGARKLLLYFVILLVTSSPVLLWKFSHSPPSLNFFHVDKQWLELLRLRSPHHLFPFSWSIDVFIRAALLICVFFISWKYKPAPQHQRIIKIFVITILTMCLAGVVFSELFPVSIILNFQLLRSFSFVYFIGIIYYSNYFISEFSSGKNWFYKFTVALMSLGIFYGASGWKYAFAAFVIFSLVLIFYSILAGKELQSKYYLFNLLAVVIVTSSGIYIRHGNFSIYNRQEKNWLDMQLWAKEHTNSNDRFIVPPYMEGFRVESERAVYCDWKDGTLLNFNPEFGLVWLRRMEKLGYRKGMSLSSDLSTTTDFTIAFSNRTEKDFLSIAADSSMQNHPVFLVAVKGRNTLNFPKVYENEEFITYRIPNF